MSLKKIFILTSILLLSVGTHAQDAGQTVSKYFSDVRSGSTSTIPQSLLLKANELIVFNKAATYLNDSSTSVRKAAILLINSLGKRDNISLRAKSLALMIGASGDADSDNRRLALSNISSYLSTEFTPVLRDSLASQFKRSSQSASLLKVIGFVNATKAIAPLQSLTQPSNAPQIRWAALLALSRMGDSNASQDILKRVRKAGISDDVVYDLFPDLIYTRNKEVFSYLIEILNSDNKDCNSAGENVSKIPCAYRVMEMLAPVIKDYPLTLDASGDINTKDYVTALQTVRTWFKQHPNYTIITDTY